MQTHSLTANQIFIKLQQILPIITHKSVRLLHAAPYVDNEISILFWLNEERKTTTKIKCVQTFQQVFFSNNIFADLKAILLNCKPHDVFYLAINGCYMYGDVQSSQVVMVCSSRERERETAWKSYFCMQIECFRCELARHTTISNDLSLSIFQH